MNYRSLSWHQYVHDIVTFRAHDWWGLLTSMIILLYLIFAYYGNFSLFVFLFILFMLVFGVFIDINAHEFYH